MSFISTNWRWQAATSPPVSGSFQWKLAALKHMSAPAKEADCRVRTVALRHSLWTATQWQRCQPGDGAHALCPPCPRKAAPCASMHPVSRMAQNFQNFRFLGVLWGWMHVLPSIKVQNKSKTCNTNKNYNEQYTYLFT